MKHTTMTRLLRRSALVVALLGLLAGTGSAYDLVADQFTWNGNTMWGFAEDTGQICGAGGTWAPGPVLEALQGDTLTVNLRNCLTVPVSIVIPGQQGALDPVMTGNRMRAFTAEAAAGGGTSSYSWTGVKAGTYLYHSGSDLATQVHMGLYGALVVDFAAGGQAYEGVYYDVDVVLLASEVDPALHDPPAMATPLNFKPKYFLANGVGDGSNIFGDATNGPFVNDRVLFRFVNAGLLNYVPTLLGEDMVFVAEDGNKYNYPVPSYGELLPAGKTMDALWTPVSFGSHALYDRRLHMSSNGAPGGGLVATVEVFPAIVPTANAGPDQTAVPLFASAGVYNEVTLDGTEGGGSGGPYSFDWTLVAFPGAAPTLVPDGTDPSIVRFTLNAPGTYTARLVVTDGVGASSAPDLVNVFTNLPPVAVATVDGPATVNEGTLVTLDGTGSYDPDSSTGGITYAWTLAVPAGSAATLSDPTAAGPTFTADVAGTYVAELTVSDFELDSAPASVAVTAVVPVNHPPVANTDFYTVRKNSTGNLFAVLANDTDPDGNTDIDPTTVTIKTLPLQGGTATVDPVTGVITYDARKGWRGTDYFTYTVKDFGGLESNVASVVVNVVQ